MLHTPAFCHDTCGVPTNEQETEEDTLSTTSTIDLRYPEEDDDYYSEEDDKGEVGMTCYTKPIPKEDETLECPGKDSWLASWDTKSEYELQCPTRIQVYAYFDKKNGHGGYGVILRSAVGKPIIASAKFSKSGKSFFCQVLKGVKAGVKLAEERQLSDLDAVCNSCVVPNLLFDAGLCSDVYCNAKQICDGCFRCFNYYQSCDVMPLVLELRGKKLKLSCSWGAAAHYLAKREKKFRAREKRIKPKDFPQQLKDILWNDLVVSLRFRGPV